MRGWTLNNTTLGVPPWITWASKLDISHGAGHRKSPSLACRANDGHGNLHMEMSPRSANWAGTKQQITTWENCHLKSISRYLHNLFL
jgi:hypothetical protein